MKEIDDTTKDFLRLLKSQMEFETSKHTLSPYKEIMSYVLPYTKEELIKFYNGLH